MLPANDRRSWLCLGQSGCRFRGGVRRPESLSASQSGRSSQRCGSWGAPVLWSLPDCGQLAFLLSRQATKLCVTGRLSGATQFLVPLGSQGAGKTIAACAVMQGLHMSLIGHNAGILLDPVLCQAC